MNIQKNIDKIIIALRMRGYDYYIDTVQFYSDKIERMTTKYVLHEGNPRDGTVFFSNHTARYLVTSQQWNGKNPAFGTAGPASAAHGVQRPVKKPAGFAPTPKTQTSARARSAGRGAWRSMRQAEGECVPRRVTARRNRRRKPPAVLGHNTYKAPGSIGRYGSRSRPAYSRHRT